MGKLFIIHARNIPKAVIIRRGPSKWCHIISWDTERDEFEHGAWIKGKIYGNVCDLSPDGQLFVYLVLKGDKPESDLPNTWTALSRPPWLKALALWPHGGTYGGGGYFTGNRKLALRPVFGSGDKCHPDFPNNYVEIDRNSKAGYHRSLHIVADADWSGYDLNRKVIFSLGDQLFRILDSGVKKQIADFSDLIPDPQPAPTWAETFP